MAVGESVKCVLGVLCYIACGKRGCCAVKETRGSEMGNVRLRVVVGIGCDANRSLKKFPWRH